jgi:heat-inducible transcriptional repressor
MMTERQAKLLAAIIEQYAEIAAPVGSVLLAKLFDVSSATVRAEMAKLEEMGYIEQPHTSAGRVPTDKGYRTYVNSLTLGQNHEERGARVIEARVSSNAERADQAIRQAVDTLVELTHNLGLATIGDQLYLSGMGNLFAQPEFIDGKHVRDVARLLDNLEPWLHEAAPNQPLNVFIGSENPIGRDSGVSLIISRFRSPLSDNSYIGVLGPTRQSYARVMNLVGDTGKMLERFL